MDVNDTPMINRILHFMAVFKIRTHFNFHFFLTALFESRNKVCFQIKCDEHSAVEVWDSTLIVVIQQMLRAVS